MAKKPSPIKRDVTNRKVEALEPFKEDAGEQFLTTNHGLRINDNQNSLKAGERGPTLLEDFILREKITHFDHERIPERVVHARGAAAHGVFQVYESLEKYTCAGFLNDPKRETPVFVRFSTVAGSRGSTDLARDVRGFAVKFYTDEGIFDLVGNNIPVFFIQDAIKFPDLIHSVKPEPHNEIPQAASAHNTFWDFVSCMPESMHMIMWAMSDRAIPRSYRMMEGFGVHTFRLINAEGKSVFVKFHWKPLLGVHSVAWDEAQIISGRDPDFHRRDLWMAIENGDYPEYELGLQIVPEEDEHKFDFDLLDPTKIIPEELVPVQRVGKLTLNRNPDNFFTETEQVAFHPGHIVPGIDFSNDPLLQGRLFSYLDTQLTRLGGPNFMEIPINRPIAPVHNNQRDGFMRQTINKGRTAHEPNRIGGGCPFQAGWSQGGFVTYTQRIEGHKVRARSASFTDHFSQAALFFNSLSVPEKNHLIDALRFELGKVEIEDVRLRMLAMLAQVDGGLAAAVGEALTLEVPDEVPRPLNLSLPADAEPGAYEPKPIPFSPAKSPALSQANQPCSPKTRRIAVMVGDGFEAADVAALTEAAGAEGASVELISTRVGMVKDSAEKLHPVGFSVYTVDSVLYDAVYVADGAKSAENLTMHMNAVRFLQNAYVHCKPIGVSGAGQELFKLACPRVNDKGEAGVTIGLKRADEFIASMARHRYWERESTLKPGFEQRPDV
ncbi:MAG: catalase [Candidatus Eremiobacteraeota bacterium]|nr:catalase [Candidatus Eremiobacteraeota bacterium]